MNEKMTKVILYLAYHFPPYNNIPSNRATELSRRLIKYGHKIYVISAKNDKNSLIDKELMKKVDSPLIIITKVHNLSFSSKSVASQINKLSFLKDLFNFILFFHWLPLSFFKSGQIIKKNKIDIAYASGPPYFPLVLGYLLKRIYKISLVIEYRDPWSYNPYISSNMSEFVKNVFKKIDKKVMKTSNAIITISEGLKEYLVKKFPSILSKKKIYVLSNGLEINSSSIPNISKIKYEKINLIFTGNLYGIRDLKPLIKIMSSVQELGKLEDVPLKIDIYGNYDSSYLSGLIHKYNVKQYFNLNGFIPRNECLKRISESTLTLHIGENFNYPTISFKVWDYLSMGKKVVYLGRNDSYTAKFLEETDFGYTISINDHDLGVKSFISLIDRIKSKSIDLNVKPESLLNYTWDKLASKLSNIFENI